MKKILITVDETLVEEILPVVLLEMKALSEKGSLVQLQALNKFSPVLEEIDKLQKSFAKRVDAFLEGKDPFDVNMEVATLAENYKIISHFDITSLDLASRIAWATLFLGEVSKKANEQEDILLGLAVNFAGLLKFSSLIAFDQELTNYFLSIQEHTVDLLEEANDTVREERPNLSKEADKVIEELKEFYTETF
jgi:hypothetical protein